jgi:hypothetical protein
LLSGIGSVPFKSEAQWGAFEAAVGQRQGDWIAVMGPGTTPGGS